jgi:hypothetical protein
MTIEIQIKPSEQDISKIKLLAHNLDCANNEGIIDKWFYGFAFPISLFPFVAACVVMLPLLLISPLNANLLDLSGDWTTLLILTLSLIATAFFAGLVIGSKKEKRVQIYMDLIDSLLHVRMDENQMPMLGKSIVKDIQNDKNRVLPTDLLLIEYSRTIGKQVKN